jgi:hypothetical protein
MLSSQVNYFSKTYHQIENRKEFQLNFYTINNIKIYSLFDYLIFTMHEKKLFIYWKNRSLLFKYLKCFWYTFSSLFFTIMSNDLGFSEAHITFIELIFYIFLYWICYFKVMLTPVQPWYIHFIPFIVNSVIVNTRL